jgi:hypothetical protein
MDPRYLAFLHRLQSRIAQERRGVKGWSGLYVKMEMWLNEARLNQTTRPARGRNTTVPIEMLIID